jgi:nitrite reductase/ring-hydroxylating ferredoxin subunit
VKGLSLCRLDSLPDPGSRGFKLPTPQGPVECLLVRRGNRFFAYHNRCPHTGAPLDWVPGQFLDLKGELIQCALHGALFLPETGECVHGPCLGAHLVRVPVMVEDGGLLVSSLLAPGDSPLD